MLGALQTCGLRNAAMQDSIPLGKAVMVAEVCRPSPSATSADVAALAAQYVQWGADAVAVCTDLEETPSGLSDLFAVCRAVRVPVLQTDWFLHPLQVRIYGINTGVCPFCAADTGTRQQSVR